jgi:hypothetical protein
VEQVGLDSLAGLDKKIAELNDSIYNSTDAAQRSFLRSTRDTFQQIRDEMARKAEFSGMSIGQIMSKLGGFEDFLSGQISSAVLSFGNSLGMALSGADDSWRTTFEKIIGVVLDFANSLAALVAAIGSVMLFIPGFGGMGIGMLAAATALAAVSTGVQAGIDKRASNRQSRARESKNIPALADGGIAVGRSLVEVGEYPGANVNPEVIMPLNKLQNLLGGMASGASQVLMPSVVAVEIQGDKLVAFIEMKSDKMKRTTGRGIRI